jgi:4,5-epoxidase
MNTGIQDAVNLGWKLSFVLRGGASTALLATYESERYPVEQRVLRNTEILTRFVALRAPILRFARDRIAPRITRTNLVQKIARETISEIGVSYHHACRNPRRIDPIGLAAGDRVPDLAIEIEDDGSSRRLYSVLDATRFTLLVLTRKRVASFEAEVGVSPQDKLARLLRARFAPRDGSKNRDDWFYLIRPDGYLAVQGPLSHIEEATAWLASLRSEEPIAN